MPFSSISKKRFAFSCFCRQIIINFSVLEIFIDSSRGSDIERTLYVYLSFDSISSSGLSSSDERLLIRYSFGYILTIESINICLSGGLRWTLSQLVMQRKEVGQHSIYLLFFTIFWFLQIIYIICWVNQWTPSSDNYLSCDILWKFLCKKSFNTNKTFRSINFLLKTIFLF